MISGKYIAIYYGQTKANLYHPDRTYDFYGSTASN